jgi:hypothetical protein
LQVYQSEIKANLYIFDFELTDEYMTTFGVETPVSRAGGLHHTPFGSSEAKVCCGRAANLCGSASFLINTVFVLNRRHQWTYQSANFFDFSSAAI